MNKYIGFKMVEAEPQIKVATPEEYKKGILGTEGYKVKYPDGYLSWSPKEVFEKAYMQVGDNNTITKDNVNRFIEDIEVSTVGEKTTLVRAILINGFEIIESSACVDKANYSEALGKEICLEKIKDKIWFLLGFLLQTAVNGIK